MKTTTNKLMSFWKTTHQTIAAYRNFLAFAFAVALIPACFFAGQSKASATSYFDAIFSGEGFAASLFRPANAEKNAVDGQDAMLSTETWTGNSFFSNKSKTNGIAIKFYMLVF